MKDMKRTRVGKSTFIKPSLHKLQSFGNKYDESNDLEVPVRMPLTARKMESVDEAEELDANNSKIGISY